MAKYKVRAKDSCQRRGRAVIAGDPDLLKETAAKLPYTDLINILEKEDEKGETALHIAVRQNRLDLVKQLVVLDENLFDRANKGGETPLKIAPYQPATNKETCAKNSSDNEGNPHHVQPGDGGEQLPKDKSRTNTSGDGGEKPLQANDDTNRQQEQSTVRPGDTPLHIAARNKYEHMVDLLLKVPGMNKLALNSEDKTPFDITREVMEYHESFRIIKKLEYSKRPFMYCVPEVSHQKRMEARKMVDESYKTRRDAELVVAALLAAMTCAAAFTVPGGFESEWLTSSSIFHFV
ncbi:hypothetical protein SUGI_0028910 [Cryptomeria japonica]|nr:hypothetical protein SUGI_0028910 [Cryptomeria japonica]